MTAERDHLPEATEAARTVVAGASEAGLSAPTPCSELDVAGLVNHFAGTTKALAAVGRGEALDPDDPWGAGDRTSDEPTWGATLDERLAAVAAAWADEARWDGEIDLGGQPTPAAMVGGIAFAEVVLHGWDLARATGQALMITPAAAAALRANLEATGEMGRQMGAYGPAVPPADGDDDLETALKLAGRDPEWQR